MPRRLTRYVRIARGVTALILVESLVFGIAALPAIGLWRWVAGWSLGGPDFVRTLVLAISVAPAYIVFSCGLMALTALACWVLGWRTPIGEFSVHALDPEVVTWAKYNAAQHVVRTICGDLFRATPIWTLYLKGMGANIGHGVYINTAQMYDPNLFTLGDHVVIGGRANLSAHLVEDGILKTKPVTFEDGATIGTGTIVSPGVHVEKGGKIGALSFVTKDTRIPAGKAYGGVPAKPIALEDATGALEDPGFYRDLETTTQHKKGNE